MTVLYVADCSLHVAIDPDTARIVGICKVPDYRIANSAIMVRGMAMDIAPAFDGEWLFVDPHDLIVVEAWLTRQHPRWTTDTIRRHLRRIVRVGPFGNETLRLIDAAVADEWPRTFGETEWLAQSIAASCASGAAAAAVRRWRAGRCSEMQDRAASCMGRR